MSKDKYAHKKPSADVTMVAVPHGAPPPIVADEIETTATLSFARSRGGSIAVMLEVDGVVTRGRADLRGKREGLADLMRCVDDLGKLVAAPVGRRKR